MIQTIEETIGYIMPVRQRVDDIGVVIPATVETHGEDEVQNVLRLLAALGKNIGYPLTAYTIDGLTVIRRCIQENVE